MAAYPRKHGILTKISEPVRFARRRFGQYEVIDLVVVLFGYAISGEPTWEAFYERLQPFAVPAMALLGRDRLPARSTLSRFLATLTAEPIEALRALFLEDLLCKPTRISGSARLAIRATESTARSYAERWKRSNPTCGRTRKSPGPHTL